MASRWMTDAGEVGLLGVWRPLVRPYTPTVPDSSTLTKFVISASDSSSVERTVLGTVECRLGPGEGERDIEEEKSSSQIYGRRSLFRSSGEARLISRKMLSNSFFSLCKFCIIAREGLRCQ